MDDKKPRPLASRLVFSAIMGFVVAGALQSMTGLPWDHSTGVLLPRVIFWGAWLVGAVVTFLLED